MKDFYIRIKVLDKPISGQKYRQGQGFQKSDIGIRIFRLLILYRGIT